MLVRKVLLGLGGLFLCEPPDSVTVIVIAITVINFIIMKNSN